MRNALVTSRLANLGVVYPSQNQTCCMHTHTHTHTHIFKRDLLDSLMTKCKPSHFVAEDQSVIFGTVAIQTHEEIFCLSLRAGIVLCYNGYRVCPGGKAAGAWR